MNLAMIPARMGSQRLKQKNLRELAGTPLIVRAIRKCKQAEVFDEIWVNSEHPHFGEIAAAEGVRFHKRAENLADDKATSEQYVYDFIKAHPCDRLFQVHSIAPLLTVQEIVDFFAAMVEKDCDVLLSCTHEQIECAYQDRPVNFSFLEKTNSQDLQPVQRICWSITAWKAKAYIEAFEAGKTATYAGEKIAFFPLNRLAGHVIKTEQDLRIAEALLPIIEGAV